MMYLTLFAGCVVLFLGGWLLVQSRLKGKQSRFGWLLVVLFCGVTWILLSGGGSSYCVREVLIVHTGDDLSALQNSLQKFAQHDSLLSYFDRVGIVRLQRSETRPKSQPLDLVFRLGRSKEDLSQLLRLGKIYYISPSQEWSSVAVELNARLNRKWSILPTKRCIVHLVANTPDGSEPIFQVEDRTRQTSENLQALTSLKAPVTYYHNANGRPGPQLVAGVDPSFWRIGQSDSRSKTISQALARKGFAINISMKESPGVRWKPGVVWKANCDLYCVNTSNEIEHFVVANKQLTLNGSTFDVKISSSEFVSTSTSTTASALVNTNSSALIITNVSSEDGRTFRAEQLLPIRSFNVLVVRGENHNSGIYGNTPNGLLVTADQNISYPKMLAECTNVPSPHNSIMDVQEVDFTPPWWNLECNYLVLSGLTYRQLADVRTVEKIELVTKLGGSVMVVLPPSLGPSDLVPPLFEGLSFPSQAGDIVRERKVVFFFDDSFCSTISVPGADSGKSWQENFAREFLGIIGGSFDRESKSCNIVWHDGPRKYGFKLKNTDDKSGIGYSEFESRYGEDLLAVEVAPSVADLFLFRSIDDRVKGRPTNETPKLIDRIHGSHMPRIRKFVENDSLSFSNEYPNLFLVFFVPSYGVKFLGVPDFGVGLPWADLKGKLLDAGIKLYVVPVPINQALFDAYKGLNSGKIALPLGGMDDVTFYDFSRIKKISNASEFRDLIIRKMKTERFATAGTVGRMVDRRLGNSDHPMAPIIRNRVDVPGSDQSVYLMDESSRRPLLEGKRVNEGRVIFLHYNPLSFDTWRGDFYSKPQPFLNPPVAGSVGAGLCSLFFPANRGTRGLRGLGWHRLSDLLLLSPQFNSNAINVRPGATIQGIRLLEDGSGIFLSLSGDAIPLQTNFKLIGLADRQSIPSRPEGVDRDFGLSNYSFRLTDSNQSSNEPKVYGLQDGNKLLHSLPLQLTQPPVASDLLSMLAEVATLTGGGEWLDSDLPTHTNPTGVAYLIFPAVLLLLLSPLCRSWAGAFAWIFSLRTKFIAPTRPTVQVNYSSKIAGLMAVWGRQVGRPDAMRHPGASAGRRSFESGDFLGNANSFDLFALTTSGRAIGLPGQRPRVRLRESSRAFEVNLIIDMGPEYHFPRGRGATFRKHFYHSSAVAVIALANRIDGAVLVSEFQSPTKQVGPYYEVPADNEMEGLFSKFERNSTVFRSLPFFEFDPGACVVMISGLIGWTADQYENLLRICADKQLDLRIVLLEDHNYQTVSGMVRDVRTGAFFDRSDRTESDFRVVWQSLATEYEGISQSYGVKFVSLNSRWDVSFCLNTLVASNILG